MPDNVPITAGIGTNVATDDVGGAHYQRVKLDIGGDGAASPVTATAPMPVQPIAATYTDRSGTITTGGTAQQLAASNAARRGFWIQNNSSGDLWINTLATAVQLQPSLKIVSGALYEVPYGGCPTGAISIIGATTAQAFSAVEW